MRSRFVIPCLLGLSVMALGLSGCRDREPVEAYPYVMKSGDMVLLPDATTLRDPKILEGTAEVVAMDQPIAPVETPAAEGTGAAPDGSAPAGGDATAPVLAMIEEYNELARKKETEALLDFVHPKLLPLAKAMQPLKKSMEELVAAIEAKTPGGSASLGPLVAQLGAGMQEIAVSNLTMTSETTATGTMSMTGVPMSVPVNFEKVGDNWYMAAANAPQNLDMAKVQPEIDGIVQEVQTITKGINDGSIQPQQAGMRIMTAVMKLGSIFASANGPAEGQPAAPQPVETPTNPSEPASPPGGGA